MDHVCPICKRELTEQHQIAFKDYHCFPPPVDHHYSKRIKDDKLVTIKVRLSPLLERLFFKINFMEGYTEVWTKPDKKESRVRVNQTFTPDFSDLNTLFKKIKTYLLFS